jgi:hypothetical protein
MSMSKLIYNLNFYQLHFNEDRPPFDEEQAYPIFQCTLERYTILAL